jgi:hypothetical protein
MSSRSDLPQDLAACHLLIEEQQATIDRLSADMALLKRALFGRRRERFIDDPRQTYLFDSTQQNTDEAPTDPEPDAPQPDETQPDGPPRRKGKGRRRRVFPAALPRKQVRHELDDECPTTGRRTFFPATGSGSPGARSGVGWPRWPKGSGRWST